MIELPRIRVYLASSMFLWVIAYVAVYAGGQLGYTPRLLALNTLPTRLLLIWTAFALLGGAALVVGFKALGYAESDMMEGLIPRTGWEKIFYVALALSAGICEEIAFRGFALTTLYGKTGSLIAAVLVSSAIFGVLHLHQRGAGALRAALLGIVLAVSVILSGSIYPAMTAHAVIDLAGGLWLAKWLFK